VNEVGLTPEKCSNLLQVIGAFMTDAKEDEMTPEVARQRAKLGYVNLYPAMKEES
jgi:hypothetical protein